MVAFTVNPNFAGQDESTHQTLGNSNVKVNSIDTVSFLGNVHASGHLELQPHTPGTTASGRKKKLTVDVMWERKEDSRINIFSPWEELHSDMGIRSPPPFPNSTERAGEAI